MTKRQGKFNVTTSIIW